MRYVHITDGTELPEISAFAPFKALIVELSSAATDPAFRNGVLPVARVGNPARVGSQRLDEPDDGGAEDCASVEDEMRRRCVEGERLPKMRESDQRITRTLVSSFADAVALRAQSASTRSPPARVCPRMNFYYPPPLPASGQSIAQAERRVH